MTVKLSGEERELRLVQASVQYMRGEIDREKFQEREAKYRPAFRDFSETLAKTDRQRRQPRFKLRRPRK